MSSLTRHRFGFALSLNLFWGDYSMTMLRFGGLETFQEHLEIPLTGLQQAHTSRLSSSFRVLSISAARICSSGKAVRYSRTST